MIEPLTTIATTPTNELTGKIAVVTGSSSGIGRAIAVELARAGADVMVHARSNRAGAESTSQLIQELGRDSLVHLADLSDSSEHLRLVEQAWQWRGGVDIWINNAGADVLTGTNANLSFEEKLKILWQVDVLATIGLSRLVGQRMSQHNRGAVILNLGWDQAEHGMAGESGEMFATTKGAVMSFSKSLAQTLAPQIRVNCLAPGWIKTSWGDDATEYWQNRAKRESLSNRWGTPEDVARVARFLASPAASFITGQTISINGGYRRSQVD
ncbi:MAG: SDR family oxidoreductase [Planctomycetaceae bacterium]|nr:SDR family oxidoreductase [Planctomycetales bacterium]MCB9921938.1 SDR family oxidoreductase [Planctomycetaceae bacterium]